MPTGDEIAMGVRDDATTHHAPRTTHRISLHGFTLVLPADWELSGLSGDTARGYIVLAWTFADRPGREAVVRVAWRRGAAVDAQRTLLALGREFTNCPRKPAHDEVVGTVRTGVWRNERGAWRAAVRVAGDVALTARVLLPDTVADLPLTDLLAGADIQDAVRTTIWSWRLHGLALDLPSAWRLRGLVHQAGLVRALWEHLPERGSRPDGLLVVRRLACADRLLAGGTPGDWLRRDLHAGDVVERESAAGGRFHLTLQRLGATWWRRWRGQRERVELTAWCDDAGRLVVVEQRGAAERLPAATWPAVAPSLPEPAPEATGSSDVPRLVLASGVHTGRTGAGRLRLTAAAPIRRRWWSRPAAALELDDIGTWVVERIDGRPVAVLADELAAHLRLTRREAEVALGDFVRQLVARRLVDVVHATNGGAA
jgi:hypothetical protein